MLYKSKLLQKIFLKATVIKPATFDHRYFLLISNRYSPIVFFFIHYFCNNTIEPTFFLCLRLCIVLSLLPFFIIILSVIIIYGLKQRIFYKFFVHIIY